jgi:DNA-binding NtrC family response regulator
VAPASESAPAASAAPAVSAAPPPAGPAPSHLAPTRTLDDVEHEAIEDALKQHRYNRRLTAGALGISRVTLREKIKRFGIRIPERGDPQTG